MFNKLLVPLNLQLFAEPGEVSSVENQDVAELEDIEGVEDEQLEGGEEVEVAEQPIEQKTFERDFEKDGAFARLRREVEQAKKDKEILEKAIKQFGFNGKTPEEIADEANAHYLQKPIEEIRAERLANERVQQIESQKEVELKYYREQEAKRLMDADLKKIQKLDPTIKNLDELGEDYFKLIEQGIDGEIAFSAMREKRLREQKKAPAQVGKINSNSNQIKDYYTKDEVDKIPPSELDDPKVWERVRKSMTKW